MPIRRIIIQVRNLDESVEFYSRLLDGRLASLSADSAALDFVTAKVELRQLSSGRAAIWDEDETVCGFRHVGFKVADLDAAVARLDNAKVRFRSRPQEIGELDVRIAFFFDPDGTLLEFFERHLDYPLVHDPEGIAAERRMPLPDRPRFDHVGFTTQDLGAARDRYGSLGFVDIGAVEFALDSGFLIDFLRHGETVLEVFSYALETGPPQTDPGSLGFAAMDLGTVPDGLEAIRLPDGRGLRVDPDGVPLLARAESQ